MNIELLMLLLVWSIAEMAIVPAPTELFVVPLTAPQNVNSLIVATTMRTLGPVTHIREYVAKWDRRIVRAASMERDNVNL